MSATRQLLSQAMMAATALAMTATATAAVQAGPETAALTEEQIAQATNLSRSLCEQIVRLTPTATPGQVEASIVYALSQSSEQIAIQKLALDRLPTACSLSASMIAGLRNAQIALLRGATSGTAGLTTIRGSAAGGSIGGGNSAFASPAIAVGGGSVNYTNTNAN